jgi:hypothetical protein
MAEIAEDLGNFDDSAFYRVSFFSLSHGDSPAHVEKESR